MIERVARAMAGYFCPYFDEIPKDKLDRREKMAAGDRLALITDITQDDLLDAACAAIEAMREPTKAMLAAAVPEPNHLYGVGGRGDEYQRQMKVAVVVERAALSTQYEAMITAALDPST